VLAAVVLSILVAFASASAFASSGPRPYVRLGGYWIDKHHKHAWAFFALRPGPPEGVGPHGAQRPCLAVAAATREYTNLRVTESEFCYGIPGYLGARKEPLIVTNTVFANDSGSATAFGVAASPDARKLKLTLGRGYRTVQLHELNRFQARKSRLRPFRYAGFLMRGRWCIKQYEVLDESSEVLWTSGLESCTESERATRPGLVAQTRPEPPASAGIQSSTEALGFVLR
jgi:hypothetical protein